MSSRPLDVSVVIPVLDDAPALAALLEDLAAFVGSREVIVVDGGSEDDPDAVCRAAGVRLLRAERGRATQLNRGIEAATARFVWMLHADTRLDARVGAALGDALDAPACRWGRFDVRLSGDGLVLRVIEWLMNRRSCLSGICTGDQGLFVARDLLDAVGGVPGQPLMEDIELSRRLKRHARPVCLGTALTTSARRWQRRGVWRTVATMWRLRLRYYLGADPADLARIYYG